MTAPQAAPSDVTVPCIGGRAAAKLLEVDERTIHRWAEDGTLAVAYRTKGGHRRYVVADLEALRNLGREAS